ncbi:MAG: hypothetical protein INR67_18465 [Jatrophihabitans endophyticus]|nr:hypothetical protein [Jatrophihabitans endophyticus]
MFDLTKLDWLNGHYLRELGDGEFTERLVAFATAQRGLDEAVVPTLRLGAPLVRERVQTLGQAVDMLMFTVLDDADFVVDEAAAAKQLGEKGAPALSAALPALEALADWSSAAIEDALRTALVDGLGLKPRNAFGPLRVALTGSTVSPPLFESMEILGRERSLARLRAASVPS